MSPLTLVIVVAGPTVATLIVAGLAFVGMVLARGW